MSENLNAENSAENMNTESVESAEYPVKKVTIKELAAMLGEDYLTTSSIVKFATKLGAIKELPEKRSNPEGKRGKPSSLFEVPNEVVLVFWKPTSEDTIEVESEVISESATPESNPEVVESTNADNKSAEVVTAIS